jgi:hypothetical protein
VLSAIAFFWALSIVYILIKLLKFQKLDLLPSSGKKREARPEDLRLAQPGGPTARVSVLPLFT